MAHADVGHYHYIFDVIKIGSRYQVFDIRDNSPVGKSHATRADAEEFRDEVDAEMQLMGAQGHGKGTIEKWLEVEHKASRFKFSPQEAGVGAGETGVAKVS
jgi:hypothetical protein